MPIPLPNLDDRRWAELVDQGRALIPLYAPEWTDHNASDPGITLMELMAWVTEMDVFQLNRIPERHVRRFLALMGLRSDPPRPARAVAEVRTAKAKVALPEGLQFSGTNLAGDTVLFQSTGPVVAVNTSLKAVYRQDTLGFHALTSAWSRHEVVAPFGSDALIGNALYLGFDKPIPKNEWVQLHLELDGGKSGWSERRRILEEYRTSILPPHHSARTQWEYYTATKTWATLQAVDDTRSFTLSGAVRLQANLDMAAQTIAGGASLYYIRCRVTAGSYDAPPALNSVTMNAVELVQAIPAWQSFPIARNAAVTGTFTPGQEEHFQIQFADAAISQLSIDAAGAGPTIRILEYLPPTALVAGLLTVEAVLAGTGTGDPHQVVTLQQHPAIEDGFALYSLEGTAWRTWERRDDLDASSRAAAHFLLNPATGDVTFGDGENGRVPPEGALLFAVYRQTLADAGMLGALQLSRVAANAHNRALSVDPDALNSDVKVTNPFAAQDGQAAETLAHTLGRAVELREARLRAVSLGDYEALALDTPGTRVARAFVRPNAYPGLDCVSAPGVVTVVVVPAMPGPMAQPSAGLLRAVARRIERNRIIGTRVVVIGPHYLEVAVRATVRALPKASASAVRDRVTAAIDAFFDPIAGGPDGTGWPFGRDIYRSEILQVIDETPGVDNVLSLDLVAEGCQPQCGNLCLRPAWLVTPGQHEIEVV